MVDLTVELAKEATYEAICAAMKAAADGPMKGVLGYTDEPLVSTDFRGDSHSSIIDGQSTMLVGDNFLKVIAWYDNEWGYSSRVADLTDFVGERL